MTQIALQPAIYEQELIRIIQKLPLERVIQILDFARYIQTQTSADFTFLAEAESEEAIMADEAAWDTQFTATQPGLQKMADKVRAEIRAKRTMPMVFTKEGGIAPG